MNFSLDESNMTITSKCGACLATSSFHFAILPYTLISLPANIWVLLLMVSSPVFWTDRMEVSEFHMVLSELLFGLLGTPLIITSLYFNPAGAIIVTELINVAFRARVQFQSTVCIERYLAVVKPLLYLKYKSLKYRMSFCFMIWLQTILVVVGQTFMCQISDFNMNIPYFFYVFSINCFCSVSVLIALKRPSPGEGDKEKSNLAKRRAFKLVSTFQVMAVLGYVPLIVVLYLDKAVDGFTLCKLMVITYSFMIWIGGFYPLIYLCRVQTHGIEKLFALLFRK